MPFATLRLCVTPGCPNRVPQGACAPCSRRREQARGTSTERGYGSAWQKIRLAVLVEEPLCVRCLAQGIVKPSEEVDHILPKSRGGTDDRSNLQGLCRTHHSRKTMTEDGGQRILRGKR